MKTKALFAVIGILALVGCGGEDGVTPPVDQGQDNGGAPPTYQYMPKQDAGGASEDAEADSGHNCKGTCDSQWGWVYKCEGPLKDQLDCAMSSVHHCHANACPSVCVIPPAAAIGGIEMVHCQPAPAAPEFYWEQVGADGGKTMMACNMPGGCPSGSHCTATSFNLPGTCL